MGHLLPEELKSFDAQLRLKRQTVLDAIRQRLHQPDAGGEMALANQYAAVREQAEADLMTDTDIGQLLIEVADLEATDEALARIAAGTYGSCSGCGGVIAARRLRAQPAAKMCLACQETFEKHRHVPMGKR